jgi:hypothetical protein
MISTSAGTPSLAWKNWTSPEMPEPGAPLIMAFARRIVPSAEVRLTAEVWLTEPINTTIPIREAIVSLTINLMVFPPVDIILWL